MAQKIGGIIRATKFFLTLFKRIEKTNQHNNTIKHDVVKK
jgi:hypothetical protein